jgi:uncharacterized protein YyaL (SSP411 family)
MMSNDTSFNRLSDENSTYLKQHKDNPVHWWSYGPEALQKAKDENKPIFLSIGYSTCHWCHVMSKENFEDVEVAQYLNENFINIKVDKEELPDLDNYYQQACHLFTQSGGWPLSAFLLPDTRPYFVGTYFPKLNHGEHTGFLDLIKELKRAFTEERERAEENAEKVTVSIREGLLPKDRVDFPGHFPPPMAIIDAIKEFRDEENGGYGEAPKFPNFSFYEWALEQMLEGMITREEGQHIVDSLEKMLMGGIFDQVRGGIHRYATDEKWLVPHFEKMLYDQAGLLRVLSKLSMLYPSPLVYDHIINTLDYISSELLSENNFFFSAQDSDSEGVEGLYFTFNKDEFIDSLNKFDGDDELFAKNMDKLVDWFQMSEEGNFDHKLNVCSLNNKKKDEIFTKEGWELIRKARAALLQNRKERIPPMTDTKGVASWNFMLISSFIDVMQYCQIDTIRQMASDLFNKAIEGMYNNFLISKDSQGMRIRHSTTREESLPYFEDYVFFAECQLRVYEVTGNATFKQNFQDTINYTLNEFINNEESIHFSTRALTLNDAELYPNQAISNFDQSFRSPAATFLHLVNKASVLFKDNELADKLTKIKEEMVHETLKNPLNAGEALRALTYPIDAFRTIQVPIKWLDMPEYINFIPYFMSRFTLDYHRDENEFWQICTATECEVNGDGLKNFMATLAPQSQEPQESSESQGDNA